MIRHLFTLIWNKKKTHALLIVEIWASFLVLFGLASLITYNVANYREPLGFTYGDVWAIDLNNNQDTVNIAEKTQTIFRRLKGYAEIKSVSRMSNNFPFSASTMNSMVSHEKASAMTYLFETDENFARTLEMPVTEGAWYRGADSVGKYKPAVINRKAYEELFNGENAVGKIITSDNNQYKVMGVVGNFKAKGEYAANVPCMFMLLNDNSGWDRTMLVRVKPGTDAVFEAKIVRDITAMIPGWSVEVNYLADSRANQHNQSLVPVIIFLIISVFLLINVALGLFGVLNVSIAKRRGEIGLRRALGATEGSVSRQFVGEMWVLATFALVLGLLLAGQFPLLNVFDLDAGVYLSAMAVSVVTIYLLVTVCALFPSRQAALVQPAVALHEE